MKSQSVGAGAWQSSAQVSKSSPSSQKPSPQTGPSLHVPQATGHAMSAPSDSQKLFQLFSVFALYFSQVNVSPKNSKTQLPSSIEPSSQAGQVPQEAGQPMSAPSLSQKLFQLPGVSRLYFSHVYDSPPSSNDQSTSSVV